MKIITRNKKLATTAYSPRPTTFDTGDHRLPITVVWKNGKNLEEVTLDRARAEIDRGQVRAWAYTNDLLWMAGARSDNSAGDFRTIWRQVKAEGAGGGVEPWDLSNTPKSGERFLVLEGNQLTKGNVYEVPPLNLFAGYGIGREQTRRDAAWFNENAILAYVLVPTEKQVQEALK